MDVLLLIAFVTTTLLFVVVPGPSVAFATAIGIRHGTRAMAVTVAGDALGSMVHIAVAVMGVTALLALSELVLPFLQIAGGIFILWMAWRTWHGTGADTPLQMSGRATFWAGFFTCVTNPKAIVFFVALFPAFMSPDHGILLQSVVYGAVFITLDAASIVGYAVLAMQAVRRSRAARFGVDQLAAMGLTGVGIAMVIKGWRAWPGS